MAAWTWHGRCHSQIHCSWCCDFLHCLVSLNISKPVITWRPDADWSPDVLSPNVSPLTSLSLSPSPSPSLSLPLSPPASIGHLYCVPCPPCTVLLWLWLKCVYTPGEAVWTGHVQMVIGHDSLGASPPCQTPLVDLFDSSDSNLLTRHGNHID